MEAVISLEGLEFYAYHGFYPEEKRLGNRYLVDVHVTTQYSGTDQLRDTINYEKIYKIVAEVMEEKTDLLETLAAHMIIAIKSKYKNVESVCAKVSKMNPPIGGICRLAAAELRG